MAKQTATEEHKCNKRQKTDAHSSPPTLPIHKKFAPATQALFRERLTDILTRVCMHNDGQKKDLVRARCAATAAIERALSAHFMTEAILITGLVLLDRVQMAEHPICVTTSSIGTIFIACVLVASKWVEDSMNGKFGMQLSRNEAQLHRMEYTVLECLTWSVWVSPEEYEGYWAAVFGRGAS